MVSAAGPGDASGRSPDPGVWNFAGGQFSVAVRVSGLLMTPEASHTSAQNGASRQEVIRRIGFGWAKVFWTRLVRV